MRSFKEWQNAKKYFEFGINTAAPQIPVQTNPTVRGVPNPVTPANPATTPAKEAPAATNSAQPQINPALQSKFRRITQSFEMLPAQQQVELLGHVDDHVAGLLAKAGKSSLFKQIAKGNVQGGREMMSLGAKGFTNSMTTPSTN